MLNVHHQITLYQPFGKTLQRSVLAAFLLLLPLAHQAQSSKNIAEHYNGWYMYFGNHRITDAISIHTEYQWRRSNWISGWQQSLMRAGLDWHAAENVTLTGGYGWIKSFPYGEQPVAFTFNEHRAWQQLILQQRSGRFYFHHRYRLEQRFIANFRAGQQGGTIIERYLFRNRARYRLLVTVPLNRKELTDKTLFAGIYDEVFLGFGQGVGKNILDQNRLYLALGWRFNKDINIQLGYLNHYVIKADGVHHERNHTLQVSLTYNLDLRRSGNP